MAVRPGEVARSLLFYPAFYGGTALFVLAGFIVMPFSRSALRWVVENWSAHHRRCAERLLGIRVVIEGNLPDHDALIALKHESFFEAIDLPHLLDFPAIFAKAELLRIPFWGKLGGTYGLIPVERDQGAKALRAMIRAAKTCQEEGRLLAIFPEGTRVPHGTVRPLQAGFAAIYKLLGRPVVPVAIDSGPSYHRWWKRRGTITYKVGEPIPPGLPRAELEDRVLKAINALNAG